MIKSKTIKLKKKKSGEKKIIKNNMILIFNPMLIKS